MPLLSNKVEIFNDLFVCLFSEVFFLREQCAVILIFVCKFRFT